MVKVGDVVYFKKMTREPQRRSPEMAFKGGHGFGVMLGIVPPGMPAPKESDLMMLMGQTGFISFDDVAAFLGEEVGKECIKKFEEKYYKPIEKKSNLILPETKPVLELTK